MNESSWKIKVVFVDGNQIEFYARDTYEADERLVYWQGVSLNGELLDVYSIPVNLIKEIREKDLEE